MRDELLRLYERELTYLRRNGAEFAEQHPGVASRLRLEANKCEDPHVERLLEGFAFLAARVHLKLEDDSSELSEALLGVLYPQYVRPIPSMAIVEMELDPEKGKLTDGFSVPRGSAIHSRPTGGFRCHFRTCYPLTLWPLQVEDIEWKAAHALSPSVRSSSAVDALRVELRTNPDVLFTDLDIDVLRFHISAAPGLGETLYELLFNNCVGVLLRDPDNPERFVKLPPSAVRPVGFADDEAVLPFEGREFQANRLLQEYFTFPAKFLYFEVAGLEALREKEFGERVELVFLISSYEAEERRQALEGEVSAKTLRLGTVPVVNLFTQASEPIRLTQRRYDHQVVADARRREEVLVFSVDGATGLTGQNEIVPYQPFYSFRHGRKDRDTRAFWFAQRRESGWRPDQGSDVHLSIVDRSGRALYPDEDQITVRVTCYNGDLPSRLPFGDEAGDFEVPGGGPIQRVLTVVAPTKSIPPPLGRPQLWKLISQLSLNYVSLVDGGPEALKELLTLHNFGGSRSAERQIEAILSLKSEAAYARIPSDKSPTFARGHDVTITLDEAEFSGAGAYLFSAVLERFLGLSVSLNTFSRLTVRAPQRRDPLGTWRARAGRKPLL